MPDPDDRGRDDDPYASGTCRWWHLSAPSPELLAAEAAGALGEPGLAVDLGCGLGTEIGYLAARGWRGLGIDLSLGALARARARDAGPAHVLADVTRLPLPAGSADLVLDRGCFHYLGPAGRTAYAREAGRVLRQGGRLLLRMCLTSAGQPNGLGEPTIRETFGAWQLAEMRRLALTSDTRAMPAVMALLIRPAHAHASADRGDRGQTPGRPRPDTDRDDINDLTGHN